MLQRHHGLNEGFEKSSKIMPLCGDPIYLHKARYGKSVAVWWVISLGRSKLGISINGGTMRQLAFTWIKANLPPWNHMSMPVTLASSLWPQISQQEIAASDSRSSLAQVPAHPTKPCCCCSSVEGTGKLQQIKVRTSLIQIHCHGCRRSWR